MFTEVVVLKNKGEGGGVQELFSKIIQTKISLRDIFKVCERVYVKFTLKKH